MARKWTIVKIINGRTCKLHYTEWKYLGDSVMQAVETEYVDEKDNTQNIVVDQTSKGDVCEQSKR